MHNISQRSPVREAAHSRAAMPPKTKKPSGAAAPPKKKKPAAKKPAANKTPQKRPPEEQGPTPLFLACQKGDVNAARLLLEKGAEVDRATKKGSTPLGIAKSRGHSSIVTLLEEHLDLKFPLHAAARTGDVDVMTHLLDGGAEIDAKKDGATPLFVACEGGIVNAARLLLEKGADVNRALENGATPLSAAKSQGNASIVALLEAHRK